MQDKRKRSRKGKKGRRRNYREAMISKAKAAGKARKAGATTEKQ